jgi:hypothetical protein
MREARDQFDGCAAETSCDLRGVSRGYMHTRYAECGPKSGNPTSPLA